MRISPRSRSTSIGLALGCALITFATACGSDASGSQVASLDVDSTNDAATTETSTPADNQEARLAFAQCMRDNGVDMEDPTFDADGNVQQGGGFGPGSGIDFGDEAAQAALEACGDLIQDIGPGGGGPGGGNFDATAIQDTFNAFTECLRDEGLEVDDIEFGVGPGGGAIGDGPDGANGTPPGGGSVPDGGFQGGPPPGGSIPDGGPGGEGFDPTDRLIQQLDLDEDDPAVTAAVEVCQPVLETAFTAPTDDAPTDETEGT
jgi:hypothetical protein